MIEENQYFKISCSAEESEIGPHYPQVQESVKILRGEQPMSVDKVLPYEESDYQFGDGRFLLAPSSNLTDVLSVSILSHGLLVSAALKDLLTKCRLQKHKFIPVTVIIDEKNVVEYHWLRFTENLGRVC